MSSAQERLRLQEELRDEVAWRTTMLIDEPPDDAPTGRQFDLFLFAYISDLLTDLEQGPMDIVECERIIGTVERGLNSDPESGPSKKALGKQGRPPSPGGQSSIWQKGAYGVRPTVRPTKVFPIRNGSRPSAKARHAPRSCWPTTRPKPGGSGTYTQMSLANTVRC